MFKSRAGRIGSGWRPGRCRCTAAQFIAQLGRWQGVFGRPRHSSSQPEDTESELFQSEFALRKKRLQVRSRFFTHKKGVLADSMLIGEQVESTHYVNVLAGDIPCLHRAEVGDDIGNILGLAELPHGYLGLDPVKDFALLRPSRC